MHNKFWAALLSLLTLVALLLTVGSTAHAATVTTVGLNGSDAVVKDRYGNVITDPSTMSKWSNYDIGYNWSIPDGEKIKAGDTAIVTLPSGSMKASDLTMPIVDANGKTIGTFTIKAGETSGVITFNDAFVNTTTNRKGTLNFYAKGNNSSDVHFNWTVNKVGWVAERDANGIPTKFTWNVAFNPTNQNLGTVVVKDTLGPNQTYIPGSVSASTGTYDTSGQFQGTGSITPQVTQAGNQLTFTYSHVTTAVNMVYDTTLNHASGSGEVVNTATMNGETVSGQITWGGSGTGGGDPSGGSVQLTKKSGTTLQALPGAVFKLLDAEGETIRDNLTTDAQGQLKLDHLAVGQYSFVETQAPSGYELDTTPIQFEIVDGATNTAEVSLIDQELPNTGEATLTKTDATTHAVLAGAVYELLSHDGAVLATNLTTNAQGQILLHDLAAGEYKLVEVKAPAGYELSTTPIPFTIVSGATTPLTLSATDVKTPTEPSEPGTPTEPGNPSEPGTPTEPETPTEPGNPSEPGTPTEPETPTEPGNPSEPGTPTEPETPTEPGNPSEPGTPTEPETPTEPGHPSEPGTPTEPETPTEPGHPTEPETPTEPGDHNDAEHPSEPGTSTEPGHPSEPAQPSEPGTSTTPSHPSTSETSSSTTSSQAGKPTTTTPATTTGQTTGTTGAGSTTTGTPATSGIVPATNGTTTGTTSATNSPATTGRLPQTDTTGSHPFVALLGVIMLIGLIGLGYWDWRRQA